MASTGEAVLVVDRTPDLETRPTSRIAATAFARALVAVSCVLYISRGSNRLWSPRLFAEDGQTFMSPAHNDGLAALWEPYAGYLHVVPRLIFGALDVAPLTWLPALYAWVSVTAFLVMAAPVLSARIAWLLPSPVARAVAFALLCLLPGGEEVYGNLSNLIFVGGLSLALFAFSDDPRDRRGRAGELMAVGLLGLSGPIGAVLAPAFVWRWWRNGRSPHSARVAGVVAVTGAVQAAITFLSHRETPGGGTPWMVVQAVSERLAGGWLYGDRPLFTGHDLPLVDLSTLLWALAALTVAVVALRAAGVVGWLVVMLTIGAPVWAYGWAFLGAPTSHQRHLLIPMGVTVVLLLASVVRGHVATRVAAVVLLLAGVGGVAGNFFVPKYPGATDDRVELTQCAGSEAAVCSFPIYDGEWSVTLLSN